MNALPNIHPVMLLIILCVRVYGVKALLPVSGFVLIETMLYGISVWTISYLYIWPLACALALPFRNTGSRLFWGMYAGLFGLLFGPLSAMVTLALSGKKAALAYWIAGIPFDVVHCISNFAIVFFLITPLYQLTVRMKSR